MTPVANHQHDQRGAAHTAASAGTLHTAYCTYYTLHAAGTLHQPAHCCITRQCSSLLLLLNAWCHRAPCQFQPLLSHASTAQQEGNQSRQHQLHATHSSEAATILHPQDPRLGCRLQDAEPQQDTSANHTLFVINGTLLLIHQAMPLGTACLCMAPASSRMSATLATHPQLTHSAS